MTLRHIYESPVTDANDPDLVGPDEWNDIHREDPSRGSYVFDECYFAGTSGVYHGGIGQNASGTGAASSEGSGTVGDPGLGAVGTGVHHPGLIQVATGTSSTGRCGLMSNNGLATGKVVLYGGGVRFGVVLQLAGLSDGTNRFSVRCGLNQTATGDSDDAVLFRYSDNVNGGNWEAVTRDGASETAEDTGVAPITDPFQKLEFVLADDASEIEYFIDGASVATISTDIPTVTTLSFMPVNIIKSLGGSSRIVIVDAYWYGFDIRSR